MPQGRVYTATTLATPFDPSIVRGNFLVFSSLADVLIDSEASHSFIASAFVAALGLESSIFQPAMFVETPIGGRVLLDRVVRSCDLTILDCTFTFDFIILELPGSTSFWIWIGCLFLRLL